MGLCGAPCSSRVIPASGGLLTAAAAHGQVAIRQGSGDAERALAACSARRHALAHSPAYQRQEMQPAPMGYVWMSQAMSPSSEGVRYS